MQARHDLGCVPPQCWHDTWLCLVGYANLVISLDYAHLIIPSLIVPSWSFPFDRNFLIMPIWLYLLIMPFWSFLFHNTYLIIILIWLCSFDHTCLIMLIDCGFSNMLTWSYPFDYTCLTVFISSYPIGHAFFIMLIWSYLSVILIWSCSFHYAHAIIPFWSCRFDDCGYMTPIPILCPFILNQYFEYLFEYTHFDYTLLPIAHSICLVDNICLIIITWSCSIDYTLLIM